MNAMISRSACRPVPSTAWGWAAFAWGVLGFFGLLGGALYRLGPIAWEAVTRGNLAWWQWGLLVVWGALMAYAEGYRGFQRRFSPRLAARALHLAQEPSLVRAVLAPFFCMGLFHVRRRVLVVSWTTVIGVSLLVLAVRQLEQPWRGIVDAGVVVGLTWGLVSCLGWLLLAVRQQPLPSGPELPEPCPASCAKSRLDCSSPW